MIYPRFSLYPNGAFMMCESVAEFDDNVQPPAPEPIKLKAISTPNEIGDPVIKTINKLKPVYDNIIIPMLTDTYDIENPLMAIDRFDRLIVDINSIVNSIRCTVTKLYSIKKLYSDTEYGPTYDSVRPHVGFIMKNATRIDQQGLATYNYQYEAVPAFNDIYATNGIVKTIAANPVLLESPIVGTNLGLMLGDSRASLCTQFESFVDMMKCVFTDMDRLTRLEETNSASLSINAIISMMSEAPCADDRNFDTGHICVQTLLKLLSRECRDISMCTYQAMCKVADEPDTPDSCMSECLQTNLMKSVNLFALGLLVSMTLAYAVRTGITIENSISDYTTLILNTLKSV